MKKIISLFIIGSATVLTSLNSPKVMAQTAEEIRRLESIKLPVVIPNYIPSGFRRSEFWMEIKDTQNWMHSSYRLSYQGPNQCDFGVVGAKGGWGAPDFLVREWIVSTKLFGRVTLEQWESDWIEPPTFLQVELINSPLKRYPDADYRISFSCKNHLFSPSEAIKILQSLKIKDI